MLKPLIIFLLLSVVSIRSFSQLDESELKAALIFKFAQMLEWENQDEINVFKIDVFSEDTLLTNKLKGLAKSTKVHSKPVKVITNRVIDDVKNMQCIFIDYEFRKLTSKTAELTSELPVLIVTYNALKPEYSMIDIYKSEHDNTLKFKINRQSLDSHGFRYNNKLLLLGGDIYDVKKLYLDADKQLKQKSKEFNSIVKNLHSLKQQTAAYQNYIDSVKNEIRKKEADLKTKEKEIQSLNKKIFRKDISLQELSKELEAQSEQKKNLLAEINSKVNSIQKAEKELKSINSLLQLKKNMIDKNQNIINRQKKELRKQTKKIRQQRNVLSWVLILSLAFLIATISIYIAWKAKRTLANKLKQMVDERTKELDQSRQYYQSLFENSPVSILEFDLSELILFLNNTKISTDSVENSDKLINEAVSMIRINDANIRALELFGAKDKDYLFENFRNFFDQKSVPGARQLIKYLLEGKEQFEAEIILLSLDRSYRNLILSIFVFPEDKEKYKKVIVSMLDITELKMYEQELMKHRDHLEELVEERSKEILKLNANLNKTNRELTDTNNQLNEQKEELLSTLEKLHKTQKQLIESEKMASLGMLTAGIAHEINNPLNFISSGNQALEIIFSDLWKILEDISAMIKSGSVTSMKKTKDLFSKIDNSGYHQSIREIIGNIQMGVDRVDEIVNSLKSYSQNSDASTSYSVAKSIENSLVILGNKYRNRIEIKKEYDENIPDIFCPPAKLDQVFINILANAFDAIDKEGIVTISVRSDRNFVKIIVKDTGSGISNADLGKIFDPFFTTKEPGKGTGLGLYITYGIVKQLGGEISISSKLNEGTTITVVLPFKQ
jgi:signal transduction histidine kinase